MRRWTLIAYSMATVWIALIGGAGEAQQAAAPPAVAEGAAKQTDLASFVQKFCVDCHSRDEKSGELVLDGLKLDDPAQQSEIWEKVVRKLSTRQMPPLDAERPSEAQYNDVVASLANALDRAAERAPRPGRSPTFRRLTRTEYQNAIRDLLAVEIDVSTLLPADEASHGFDNVTVSDLSPTLLDRYVTAAQKISRLAVGGAGSTPAGDTFRTRADLTQEEHVEGLPLGTRGGILIPYHFPQTGEYEITARLTRDRNEEVEGLSEPHEMELLLDRERLGIFTVKPPPDRKTWFNVDQHLKLRANVSAGPHKVGVTFLKNPSSLLESKRQPYHARYNYHRHPRVSPAVYEVSITGPHGAATTGDTPSRRKIFVAKPASPDDEAACAQKIIAALARRAYRREVTDAELEKPLALYRQARATGDFDAGIELATSAILVSPHFLFHIERDPPGIEPKTAYRLSDVELASRLSFLVWSSIPDDELLDLATRGELSKPDVLERQVRRMLADPRSRSLSTNFAGQWLHLRNLESISPDLRLFPDFDHNARQALARETELLFDDVVRGDKSVLALLRSDATWLNERLAKHYGIPHVYGSHFRRVELAGDNHRSGLLTHGSILTVSSYATRTSPVIRGKWILENLWGTPPPPPPANVPALKDKTVSASLSVRERLAEHRNSDACMSCHRLIDPVGFSLENFDAVGRWREMEEGKPVDSAGGLPDGSAFTGVEGLEKALLARPELFARTLAEKLLTFAIGRGVEPYDAPAVRKIVAQAGKNDYRFTALVVGIATSVPFQMRTTE